MFKKTILIACCTMILTFNFTMSYAKANSATANFEEWAAAQYATVVTTTTAVAAGAMHTQQYVLDNATEIYNTAKATWPSMSADMKSNFLSSLNQMQDGVIGVGDWLTAGLDALKAKFGGATTGVIGKAGYRSFDFYIDGKTTGYQLKVEDRTYSRGIYFDAGGARLNKENSSIVIYAKDLGSSSWHLTKTVTGDEAKILNLVAQLNSINTITDCLSILATMSVSATLLNPDGSIHDTSNAYSRLDEWMRERAIPNGQLRVYNPGAQAHTPDGYRLGLSADGQTLLKLPDGIPWEGTADWKQPLLNTIDGTSAVLDTAVGSWLDVATGQKIRDATAAEIAKALGVSLAIAEGILTRAKQEEAIRNQNKGEGGTTGSLKNPTKAIVWTPLMMAGSAMTTKFPFSLPWDLINQLKIFDVAPQAPKFDINVPDYLQIGGQTIPLAFTLDLSLFDKVASVVRWFNVIIWDIALILILRRLLPE